MTAYNPRPWSTAEAEARVPRQQPQPTDATAWMLNAIIIVLGAAAVAGMYFH